MSDEDYDSEETIEEDIRSSKRRKKYTCPLWIEAMYDEKNLGYLAVITRDEPILGFGGDSSIPVYHAFYGQDLQQVIRNACFEAKVQKLWSEVRVKAVKKNDHCRLNLIPKCQEYQRFHGENYDIRNPPQYCEDFLIKADSRFIHNGDLEVFSNAELAPFVKDVDAYTTYIHELHD